MKKTFLLVMATSGIVAAAWLIRARTAPHATASAAPASSSGAALADTDALIQRLDDGWAGRKEPDGDGQLEVATFLDEQLGKWNIRTKSKAIECKGALCRILLEFANADDAEKLRRIGAVPGVEY